MKKISMVLVFLTFAVMGFSQKASIFRPVPDDLFKNQLTGLKAPAGTSTFLWRLSAIVTATELTWVKAEKQFVSAPLSSVGPAIGYRHFVALEDGTPYNDWGVNMAVLVGTDINNVELAKLKAAITVNAFSFVNIGGVYTFKGDDHWGILIGTSINF